ncbi:hypothetical protein PpBr36_07956 [Pyricularia pennisetigena]|uniref:hypothetical protein n=1 Tax=Pyricularia pennisetigena TaxID=1578925 RepID=UPI001151E2DB|nr:hypothetical protein PpBr36_07956 [Pyricularia pennisetigena]TLS25114.1 hypothetical protein PpBr36_07956 [Pyricularia pennisetigena]
MASLPNLLRDSKINALKEQLRRLRTQPITQQQQQQQEPQTPKPAEILRTFTAAKKRQDSASALHNKECFNKLWALGREPERLVANPRLHALHISQSRPRRTGPDDVRKQSLLALEVRPEDVVDVEMVDGWSLCSDDLEEEEEEEEEGVEADEAGEETLSSAEPRPEGARKRQRVDRQSPFSVADTCGSDPDRDEHDEGARAAKADEIDKSDPPPSHPLYENLREEEEKVLGLLRLFDKDRNAEVKEDPSVADMDKGLSRSDSNGGLGGWDNTVWVVDADNPTLGYSQSGNGYWIKW